ITHDIATHRPLHSPRPQKYSQDWRGPAPTQCWRDYLRHHGDQDWSPCREHDITNGVGHGIAESGEVALRLFLDRAKRGGDRPRARTSTQDDDRVHLQHITTE